MRLWAAALLFSQLASFLWLNFLDSGYGFFCLLTFVCASWVVFRGAGPWMSLALIFVSVAQSLFQLPYLPNHEHVTLFFNLLLATGVVFDLLGRRAVGSSLFTTTKRYGRYLLVAVYGFAAFAKLNSSYLDPRFSCSVVFYDHIVELLPFLPSSKFTAYCLIYGSLVVEAAIPLLLLRKRSVHWAVAIGLLFHFGLAFDLEKYFINFSSVMTALLVLSLPQSFFAFLGSEENSLLESRHGGRFAFALQDRTLPIGSYVLLLLTTLIGIFYTPEHTAAVPPIRYFCGLLWLSLIVPLLICFFRYARSGGFSELTTAVDEADARPILSIFQLGIFLLVLLNGLAPYLGLKTRTAFNMYSNLRIEPAYSNHLIAPTTINLFPYLSDLVELQGEEDRVCWNTLIPGAIYPRIEVLRSSMLCTHQELSFLSDGEVTRLNAEGGSVVDLSLFERKIPIFRPLGRPAETECIW